MIPPPPTSTTDDRFAAEMVLHRERLYTALGVPISFLTESTEYSSAELVLQTYTARKQAAIAYCTEVAYRTKVCGHGTDYHPRDTFRQFWLRNFPSLLALRIGRGSKRIRKKRLKHVLQVAYIGHLLQVRAFRAMESF